MGRIGLLLLVVAVFLSATGVVYSKHQSRKLFVELQELQKLRDQLDVRWGQLQLEQSAYASHGLIENAARERLGMRMPTSDDIVLVRP